MSVCPHLRKARSWCFGEKMNLIMTLRRPGNKTKTDWISNEVPGERGQVSRAKDGLGNADGSGGLEEEWRVRNSDSGCFPSSREQH